MKKSTTCLSVTIKDKNIAQFVIGFIVSLYQQGNFLILWIKFCASYTLFNPSTGLNDRQSFASYPSNFSVYLSKKATYPSYASNDSSNEIDDRQNQSFHSSNSTFQSIYLRELYQFNDFLKQ